MMIVAVGHGLPAAMLRELQSDQSSPGPGEIAVDVRAAAVNRKDIKVYADEGYGKLREGLASFPMALGLEAAGVVTAVGSGATGPLGAIREGDEVIAYRIEGAYASRVVVPSSSIIPKPKRLNWAQAGSMMLTGTTAFHCLAATVVRPGDTVLVHGAAGAVGRFVTQLAALAGARVVGTVSEADVDLLPRWGATPVTRGPRLKERIQLAAPEGIAAAIDTVGADDAIDASLALVSDRERIATIVNFARSREEHFQALGGEAGGAAGQIRDNARYIIAALAQAGVIDVHVDRCFPLSSVADAHELARKGGAGRFVLIP